MRLPGQVLRRPRAAADDARKLPQRLRVFLQQSQIRAAPGDGFKQVEDAGKGIGRIRKTGGNFDQRWQQAIQHGFVVGRQGGITVALAQRT
jgi:hypothetical protein